MKISQPLAFANEYRIYVPLLGLLNIQYYTYALASERSTFDLRLIDDFLLCLQRFSSFCNSERYHPKLCDEHSSLSQRSCLLIIINMQMNALTKHRIHSSSLMNSQHIYGYDNHYHLSYKTVYCTDCLTYSLMFDCLNALFHQFFVARSKAEDVIITEFLGILSVSTNYVAAMILAYSLKNR
uniref:Uncharacterized protein n=1 Tax=Glossina austeni TaxID=7395 RepID=A0A1A9VTY1_GLOAU